MSKSLVRQDSLIIKEKVDSVVQLSNQNARTYRSLEQNEPQVHNLTRVVTNSQEKPSLLQKSKHRDSVANLLTSRTEKTQIHTSDEKVEEIKKLKKELSLVYINIDQQQENVPISPFYLHYTHKTEEFARLKIVFNYDFVDPQYYVINQLQDGDYIFSEALIDVKQDQVSDSLMIKFAVSDIGYFPHLLIQDGKNKYFIPLTYQPVQPCDSQKTTFDQVKRNIFHEQLSIINLDTGKVMYGSIKTVNNKLQLLSSNNKEYAIYDSSEIDCALPCVLYLQPGEHPTTFQSQKWYDQCLIYQNRLSFSADIFFLDYFSQIVYKNDSYQKVCDDTSCYMILKIRSNLVALNFDSRIQRDFCYLAFKKFVNHLNLNFSIEDEAKKGFIKANRSYQQQKYQIPKEKQILFEFEEGKEIRVGSSVQIKLQKKDAIVFALVSTTQNILDSFQCNSKSPTILQPELAFKEIELVAFTQYSVQLKKLSEKLLPTNYEEISGRMDQLNERGIIVRATYENLLQKKYPVKMVLIQDKIVFEIEELQINIEALKYNLAVNFNFKNRLLLIIEEMSYDIQYLEKDFYFLNLFFG